MNSRFILLAAMLALAAAANNNVAVALLGIDGGYPNKLYNFLASNPALVRSTQTVSGLAQGETLLAIAKYPTADTFFAVSNLNKIYQLNATTAVASFTADLSCNVQHTNPTLSISFDPSTLQLHIMSLVAESSSNHFVADAFTGACQQMPVLSYGSSNLAFPSPAGIAYFNGKAYVVDANANSALSTINGDSLAQVGSLMHDFSGVGGFAIATADGQRYFGLAALYTPYQSSLWAINLATGQSFEAATLGKLITNLVGFAVMADGRTIDFPFPYLGDEYNPNIDYTYTPPTNFNQDDLFGTQTNAGNNGNTSPAGNSNTGANSGNTNVSPSTGNNGNNGNTPATSADAATGNGNNGNTATNGDNDNAATSGNSANTATDANNANTATNVSPSNGNGDNGNNNLNTVNRQQGSATTFGVSLVLVAAVALLAF